MDIKTTIESETVVRRILDGSVRDSVYITQKALLESLLGRLIEQRNSSLDGDRPGLIIAVDMLLTYLQALRDSFSK